MCDVTIGVMMSSHVMMYDMMSYLISDQFLVEVPSRVLPEQLAQPGQFVRLEAHHKVNVCPGEHLDDGLHLHLHLQV